MKKISITALLFAGALVACKTSQKPAAATTPPPATAPAATGITYVKDVQPLMKAYCTNCHNENQKAGYNFLEISFVKKAAGNGELLGTIKHLEGYDPMPAYAEKMNDADIAKIEAWIKGGMN